MARLSGPKARGRVNGLGAKSNKILGTKEDAQGSVSEALTLIRGAVKEKNIAAKEKAVKTVIQDFLKKQGMEHVEVNVKFDKKTNISGIEKYVETLLTTISKESNTLFKEGISGINILSDNAAIKEIKKGTELSENLGFSSDENGRTHAEVATTPNWNPDRKYPHDMHLNFYIPESGAVPDDLHGIVAHELTHLMEKKWADSLMSDYALIKTGNRIMDLDNDGVSRPDSKRMLVRQQDIPAEHAEIYKTLQEKSKNDPDFKRQMEFVKEWEGKSAFAIKEIEVANSARGTSKIKDWVFSPNNVKITQPGMTGTQVIAAAFNLNAPTSNYVLKDAERKSNIGASVSPAEELAEAVRVAKDPDFPAHMDWLARSNPDAKVYLEGLLSVVAKYDDVVKDRMKTISKDASVLKTPVVKKKRTRKPKNEEISSELAGGTSKTKVKKSDIVPF